MLSSVSFTINTCEIHTECTAESSAESSVEMTGLCLYVYLAINIGKRNSLIWSYSVNCHPTYFFQIWRLGSTFCNSSVLRRKFLSPELPWISKTFISAVRWILSSKIVFYPNCTQNSQNSAKGLRWIWNFLESFWSCLISKQI